MKGAAISAATLALVFALAVSIVATHAGSAWLAATLLARYNASIPGSIRTEFSGSFFGPMTLRSLELRDRQGNSIASVQEAAVVLDLWPLLGGEVHVQSLALLGVKVDARGHWGDLAAEGGPSPRPAPPLQLPRIVVETLSLRDASVNLSAREEIEQLLAISHLELSGIAQGSRISASVRGAFALPELGIEIDELQMSGTWHGSQAWLDDLSVRGNFGAVRLHEAELALDELAWQVENFSGHVDRDWLVSFWHEAPLIGDILVNGHVDEGRLHLALHAALENDRTLFAQAVARWPHFDEFDLDANLLLVLPEAVGSLPRVHLQAFGHPGGSSLVAQALLEAGTSTFMLAEYSKNDAQTWQAGANWESANVREVEPILALLSQSISLHGRSSGNLACEGEAKSRRILCASEASVENAVPGNEFSVQADVRIDKMITATIHRLDLKVPKIHFNLQDGPAIVTWHGDELEVRGLALEDRRRRGLIALDGHWHRDQEMQGRATIRQLDLRILDAFFPDLGARGRLDATWNALSKNDEISIHGKGEGRGIALNGSLLGNLKAVVDVGQGDAALSMQLSGQSWVKTVALDATFPLTLHLASAPTYSKTQPIAAHLKIHDVDLARIPEYWRVSKVSGIVSADVEISGTPRAPLVTSKFEGEALAWDLCCHRPRSAVNHAPTFVDTDARAQHRKDAPTFTERSRILPEAQSELGWQIISTMSIPTRGVDMVEIWNRTGL